MYAATVDGERLTFDVAGVWRRNMVMRDRQTGTIWQHATGEALAGPLRGTNLEPIGGAQLRWAAWRREYPETRLAVEPARFTGRIPKPILMWILDSVTPNMAAPGFSPIRESSVAAHTEVAGVQIDNHARAYPLSRLQEIDVINDTLGDVPIAVVYEREADHVRVFDRRLDGTTVRLSVDGTVVLRAGDMRWDRSGRPVAGTNVPLPQFPVERQWWLGWKEFHPESTVYTS